MKKILSWVVAVLSVLAACVWLAYVGSSVGPAYGAGFSEWIPTLRVLLIGVLCLLSTFVALQGRNWFAFLFHAIVALLGGWFAYLSVVGKAEQREPFSDLVVPSSLYPAILLLIVPGVFWYITGRAGWPRLVSNPLSVAVKVAVPIGLLAVTLFGAVIVDFMTIWSGRCHFSEQPFTQPVHPAQAVFTAHIIGSGKLWGSDAPSWYWRRYWTLAWVQRQFWGLPWWDGKIVVLLTTARGHGTGPPGGEIDFVDGRRLPGSLTRFLPIFDTFCTRTGSIADSEVDLRVLRDGRPHNGIRILGRTFRLTHPHNDEWSRWVQAPTMRVMIRGEAGVTIAESDEHGVYDVTGLPPGMYEISRPSASGVPPSWRDVECQLKIDSGEIRECNVLFH